MVYLINIGGVSLRFAFIHDKCRDAFMNYTEGSENSNEYDVKVSEELFEREKTLSPEIKNENIEKYTLIGCTTHALIPYKRFLYHGLSFIWKGKAWILTGPSGVGKTTQYSLWESLKGNKIELINGDKPVVECRNAGDIWVHPSPWNGKENYSGMRSARLGGIVLLEQADENQILLMDKKKAAKPLFMQTLTFFDDVEDMRDLGRLVDQMVRAVPIWKLRNKGDIESSILTCCTLEDYIKQEEMKCETS